MASDSDIKIAVELQLGVLRKQMDGLKKIMSSPSKMKFAGGMISKEVINIDKQIQALEKRINTQPPFAGYAMSIMFAGMAIQRTMSQITKFGTKAFNDISHSVEGTVTASDKLEGSMKYLGFTIGQALEPVLEWLIPVVDKIGEWVDAHPGLVRIAIVLGTIAGTLLTFGGMFKLAYDGFVGLGSAIESLAVLPKTGIFGLTMSTPFVVVLAGLAGMVLAFNKAMEDSPAFKKNFETEILSPLKNSINELVESFDELFKEVFNSEGVVDTIGGLFLIIARVVLSTLVPALTILAETWGNVAKAATAGWLAIKGKGAESNAKLAEIDWSSSKKALSTATENMNNLLTSLSEGKISISGQMEKYIEPKPVETNNINNRNLGFSSMNNDSPVIYINNNYMSQDLTAETAAIMNKYGFGTSQSYR